MNFFKVQMRRSVFIKDNISVDTDGSIPVASSGFDKFQYNKSISILREISGLFDHINGGKCFQNWCENLPGCNNPYYGSITEVYGEYRMKLYKMAV